MIDVVRELLEKFYMKVLSIQENGKKPSVLQLARHAFGIAINYIMFEFTITDYFELTLYNKSLTERSKYLSYKKARRFAEFVDGSELIEKYLSKTNAYHELQKYIERDQLFSNQCSFQEFRKFFDKHGKGLYKPDALDCGRGIEVWKLNSENEMKMYDNFCKSPAIIDQMLIQHRELQKLCPSSVNTVRIFSVMIGEDCEIIGAALRMGNGESIVDNYSAGGFVGSIDISTGRVIAEAEDATGKRYKTHPYTGVEIVGYQVPLWNEVLQFVRKCAANFGLKYCAWDIAILGDKCALIEVNPNGMTNTIQIAGAGGRKAQYSELQQRIKCTRANGFDTECG